MNINYLYKNGLQKALVMSYDDGDVWDRRLVEMFNKYGIRGTFHINAGLMDRDYRVSPEEAKTLYKGHEIAAHSFSHPFFDQIPKEAYAFEIGEDKRLLEEITGEPVRGYSYPNGFVNDEVRTALSLHGIKYSRVVKEHGRFGIPNDFLMWEPTMHHAPSMIDKIEEFKNSYYAMPLFFIWGHSHEFPRAGHNTTWETMEEFCDKFTATLEDTVWYATCIEIYNYITALRSLSFTTDLKAVYNPSAQTVWISVDGTPVMIPSGTTHLK